MTKEQRERKNANERLRLANMTEEQKQARRLSQNRWNSENLSKIRDNNNSYYSVYTHTLGDKIYIGSGNKRRAKRFGKSGRRKAWLEAFTENPRVDIVSNIKTKELSLLLESMLINLYGLDNLVNKRRPNSVKEFILNKYSV